MRRLLLACWPWPAGHAGSALAQTPATIVQARGAGLVGERYDGYLGFVATPSAELRRQVNAINIRRRSLYYDLAARKGVTPQEVGITAGCSLLAAAWRRRRLSARAGRLAASIAPGQRALPSYCG